MQSLPIQAFLSALPARPADEDGELIERAVFAAISIARAAHPALDLDPKEFARYLGEKVGRTDDAVRSLAELRPGDLALTFACAQGDRQAMEILDREVIHTAARVTSRIDATATFIDEVRQRLRERLLLAERGARPRINEYSGKGSLQAWTNVTAMRLALNLKAVPAREVPLDLEALDPSGDTTMESRVARGRHGPELIAAFTEAAGALSAEERLLLRYHFADGLNFEQIAPLFHTHRSTISRKIAAARKKLLEGTRKALKSRLGADQTEVSSLLKMAHSRLDVEITAVLREKE